MCITPSATHHSIQSSRSARSPAFCSFLFFYKGEFIYSFHTEVAKRSEEFLPNTSRAVSDHNSEWRSAEICWDMHCMYIGLRLEKPRAVSALGTKTSRSQRQQQPCPYGARETCSRDGHFLLPKLLRMIIASSLSLLPLPDRCSIPRGEQYTQVWAGEMVMTGPAGPWGRWQGQLSETLSHQGQMESETTALKSLPHYCILLSQ